MKIMHSSGTVTVIFVSLRLGEVAHGGGGRNIRHKQQGVICPEVRKEKCLHTYSGRENCPRRHQKHSIIHQTLVRRHLDLCFLHHSTKPFFYPCMCMLNCFGCVWLCDPVDCSTPGSSVHRILQARILEWVAMPSSRESSQPRDQTCITYISCINRQFLLHGKPMHGTQDNRTCVHKQDIKPDTGLQRRSNET